MPQNPKNFEVPIDVNGNITTSGKLNVTASSGDEGGEIFLANAVTNTTINTGVTIDVYQNKLRFFEQGGTTRGYYIDITGGGTGAGTNLVGGGAASNSFATISTPSGTSPVADSSTDTLTFTAGTGITITGDATADSIAFATNGASANGASTLVLRDSTGNFSANTITATLVGSASTLTTARSIWGQSFNGSADVTGNLTNVGTITGTAGTQLTVTVASSSATGTFISLVGGATSSTTSNGGTAFVTGGAATGGTGVQVGGAVTITGGAGNSTGGIGGTVNIAGGSGSSGNNGNIQIGNVTTQLINIGNTTSNTITTLYGTVYLPAVLFTGTQTIQAASTQDAVKIAGRAGGTSSYAATITPTTLSANRTITLPDANITVGTTLFTHTITFDGGSTEGTNKFTFDGSSVESINFAAGTNITFDTSVAGTITISSSGSGAAAATISELMLIGA